MFDPLLPFDVFSWNVGRLAAHASLVNRGVRPVAEVLVREDALKDLLVDSEVTDCLSGLRYHLVPRGDNHIAIYIFKHSHLCEVIKHQNDEKADDEVFATWANGKMFGYSEEAIAEFVAGQQMVSLGT